MSFVAFPANFAGSPPGPFRPFPAGTVAFYLVGVARGTEAPAPGRELSVVSVEARASGCGKNYATRTRRTFKCQMDPGHNGRCGWTDRVLVDTIVETAKARDGRGRFTDVVATRTYSWARFTKGAKRAAAESTPWTAPNGGPITIWSNLVSVADAEGKGYSVPGGQISARPGRRGVGVEHNALGAVHGRNVVAIAAPAPQAAPQAAAKAAPQAAGAIDPGVARFRLLDLSSAVGPREPELSSSSPGRIVWGS